MYNSDAKLMALMRFPPLQGNNSGASEAVQIHQMGHYSRFGTRLAPIRGVESCQGLSDVRDKLRPDWHLSLPCKREKEE